MPKQIGLIKFQGTLDDLVFYKTPDGYLIRKKNGVSAQRLKTDPAYERFREHQSEFARAGKAARLVRTALHEHLRDVADYKMTGRLVRILHNIILTDTTHARGARTVTKGNIKQLEGFEFNDHAPFSKIFQAPCTTTVDHANQTISLNIPAFIPTKTISYPDYATHARLYATVVSLNFDEEISVVVPSENIWIDRNGSYPDDLTLNLRTQTDHTGMLCLVIGIRFFQEVNGEFCALKNSTNNALAVTHMNI